MLRSHGLAFGLVQNAWDTETERGEIDLQSIPNRTVAKFTLIESDLDRYKNLDYTYALFAESERKDTTK